MVPVWHIDRQVLDLGLKPFLQADAAMFFLRGTTGARTLLVIFLLLSRFARAIRALIIVTLV